MSNIEPLDRSKEEERFQLEGRLPPGQALTLKFPVLHYGSVPAFDALSWDLRIWGEVEEEKTWGWEEFCQLPRSKVMMDLHCVTGWSKADTLWEGVSVRTLVEQQIIKIKPEAAYVLQHAEHGFTVNLPLAVVLQENFLMATHFNGEPLTPEHGYPVRGVTGGFPGRNDKQSVYLWKGAKWLRGLEFMRTDKPGFWEQAGYSNSADVWEEERYA